MVEHENSFSQFLSLGNVWTFIVMISNTSKCITVTSWKDTFNTYTLIVFIIDVVNARYPRKIFILL